MRVLHVDDDPDDRALVRRAVVQSIPGVELRDAATEAGLDSALAGFRPDVAVVDFSLGWSNGLEVFRRIRNAHPDCCVAMYTGSLGEEGAVEVMRAGLDDYLLKGPDRLPRLVAAIEGLARRAEERRARRRAEARNDALRRSATIGMLTCRPDGTVVDANPAARRLLTLGDGRELGSANLLSLLSAASLGELWAAPGGTSVGGLEVSYGVGRSALLDAQAAAGADNEVECVLTDVTELRAAVRRAEALLREVNHRVYNNLQIIDALLGLQARRARDPEARAGFRDVGRRLRALALVQQRLHRGDTLDAVDFAGYLRDLGTAIADAHRASEVAVEVKGPAELRLPVDVAIPLGLVATELLTNAYKHAFPGERRGRVVATIAPTPLGGVELTVADDGIGMPAGALETSRTGGVGSAIVGALAAQLGATIDIASGEGTVVTVGVPPASLQPPPA